MKELKTKMKEKMFDERMTNVASTKKMNTAVHSNKQRMADLKVEKKLKLITTTWVKNHVVADLNAMHKTQLKSMVRAKKYEVLDLNEK